ncbi:MAG: galactokinase [Anaerolineae bacterium]|nr:galactokinase [Anaerolineae bacterium]
MIAHDLAHYYGHDGALLDAQRARYGAAAARLHDLSGPGPVRFVRTPGRINLIGEHTDYNGGFVLPVALDRDVLFAVRARDDGTLRVANVETRFPSFSFAISADIPRAPQGDWRNYFQGAAQELCRRYGALAGIDVVVSGAPPLGVPRGAGLSSSTALTVNAALALVARNGIQIERAELAHLCSEAEWYVGTRGGMMDQFSALLCRRDHALFLDCRPSPDGVYRVDHVPVPASVQVVLLNSGVHHENARGAFNQRVAECKVGVHLVQRRYPTVAQLRDVIPERLDLSEDDFWAELEELLPARATAPELVARGVDAAWLAGLIADHGLDPEVAFAVLPRCRHVITENERVLAGVTALRAGQVETFGLLMDGAHASMSGDYDASCSEVDTLVALVCQEPGVLGARITGAGWGGGVVALVRRETGAEWAERVRVSYRAATGLDPQIYLCRPASGAGEVEDPG